MNLGSLLFSFEGRINRAKFWLTAPIYLAAWIVVIAFASVAASNTGTPAVGFLIWLACFVPMVISTIAVGVKRLHDRDKSGWWLLVFYVLPGVLDGIGWVIGGASSLVGGAASIAISIWAFVELGCLRGTDGYNQHGPDPLQAA
jgi:uncharacterized membrane protein YhaH (DUF805 family)